MWVCIRQIQVSVQSHEILRETCILAELCRWQRSLLRPTERWEQYETSEASTCVTTRRKASLPLPKEILF
jgi:hypothetical protein